jgi:uncharacterized iron-regulated membrane protein
LFGFFALIFLLNTTTGVILYRQNILAVLTFRKRMFRKKHLHQLIGVYALLFNLMIGITGFWMQRYVLKKEFYNATEHKPVFRSSPPLFFSLDSSLRALKNSFPEFTAWVIYFPADKKARTAVYGSRSTNSFIHSKKLADLVLLDSAGRVAGTAFVDEISPSNRYDIINAQLHFGQYGGWTVKVLYCLLGLSGGMLGITGFWFWCKRKKLRLH